MTEKIGSYPRTGTETRTGSSNSTNRSARGGQTQQSETATQTDAISLTDTATRLQGIEARIKELPEVDQQRVAELRQQLDAGEYEINPSLIAKRIVALEQALS